MDHSFRCPTCYIEHQSDRKDKRFCSRICYRRYPENARKYSARTNAYQARHAKEPERRFEKLAYKCKREAQELNLTVGKCFALWMTGCFYCKASIVNETGCGLDRLDNARGYTLDNVVPCCGSCNKIRNRLLTHEEMIVAMAAVLDFRRNLCPKIDSAI